MQLADLQALQQAPPPTSLHTAQPLPLPPNLASLPPHVLRDYSPITRAGSAGSVGSEVPLLGALKTACRLHIVCMLGVLDRFATSTSDVRWTCIICVWPCGQHPVAVAANKLQIWAADAADQTLQGPNARFLPLDGTAGAGARMRATSSMDPDAPLPPPPLNMARCGSDASTLCCLARWRRCRHPGFTVHDSPHYGGSALVDDAPACTNRRTCLHLLVSCLMTPICLNNAPAAGRPSGSASRGGPWARSGRSTARAARRRGSTRPCCRKARRWGCATAGCLDYRTARVDALNRTSTSTAT